MRSVSIPKKKTSNGNEDEKEKKNNRIENFCESIGISINIKMQCASSICCTFHLTRFHTYFWYLEWNAMCTISSHLHIDDDNERMEQHQQQLNASKWWQLVRKSHVWKFFIQSLWHRNSILSKQRERERDLIQCCAPLAVQLHSSSSSSFLSMCMLSGKLKWLML